MVDRSKKAAERDARKLDKARKEFERLQREIEPFIKKRPLTRWSTAGRWRHSESLVYDGGRVGQGDDEEQETVEMTGAAE